MILLSQSGLPEKFVADMIALEYTTSLDLVWVMRREPEMLRKWLEPYGLNYDVLLTILKASLTAQELEETVPPPPSNIKKGVRRV